MIYKRKKKFVDSRNHAHRFLRWLFWFTFVIFLGAVIYVLFFSSFLAVASLKITGNSYISESDLAAQVEPEISGQIWKIINRNNLLLVRKNDIQKDILNNFRQVRSVTVHKKFPSELDIVVSERTPTLFFQGANGWFALDENAVAYDSADPNAPNFKKYNLPQFTDADGKTVNLGEAVLSQDYLAYILAIREKMESNTEVQLQNDFKTPSLISDDVRVKTQEGWGIYFNENINLDKEIEMLNAVLSSTIDKSQRPDLDYIDLRIDNKVYYKYKDGTPEETARLAQSAQDATAPPAPASASSDSTGGKKKK